MSTSPSLSHSVPHRIMWNRYTWRIVGGLAVASVGMHVYDMHQLLHPLPSFLSSPNEMRFAVTGLAQRLSLKTTPPPQDLREQPRAMFYLVPVLPVELIKNYVKTSEADFLVVDFDKVDFKNDNLFQYLYSRVRNPPPISECTAKDNTPMCFFLMQRILHNLMARATLHMQLPETEWYHTAAILAFLYTFWYGKEAYENSLGKPRFPVIVLQNTARWADVKGEEILRLLDFYVAVMRLTGTAHIFIESAPGVAEMIEEMHAQLPKPQNDGQTESQ